MPTILGIDPSSTATGWALIDTSPELLDWGAIEPGDPGWYVMQSNGKRSKGEGRSALIAEAVAELLDKHAPDVVAYESPFMKYANTALVLGCVKGAVLAEVCIRDIPCYEYAPRMVKMYAGLKGNAAKTDVRRMVCLEMGLDEPASLDQSDALAVALTHLRVHGEAVA